MTISLLNYLTVATTLFFVRHLGTCIKQKEHYNHAYVNRAYAISYKRKPYCILDVFR